MIHMSSLGMILSRKLKDSKYYISKLSGGTKFVIFACYSDSLCSPHQCERLISFSESASPSGVREYLTAQGVSAPICLARMPARVSSSSRSERILVFASPIALLIVLKLWDHSFTACMMKMTHFFPRSMKSCCAFGHVHWGLLVILDAES